MNKRGVVKKQQRQIARFGWLWAIGALLILIVGGIAIWNGLKEQPVVAPQVNGSPRLTVEQTLIDEGDVKLGKTIRSVFRLQNVGDQPLQIASNPQVEVVEGC